jgi:hypothetical protein
MTISPLIRVVEVMMPRIFNCFVLNAIEVNRIAAIVKYIIEKLALIVAKVLQQCIIRRNTPLLVQVHRPVLPNAQEQHKKARDAKT